MVRLAFRVWGARRMSFFENKSRSAFFVVFGNKMLLCVPVSMVSSWSLNNGLLVWRNLTPHKELGRFYEKKSLQRNYQAGHTFHLGRCGFGIFCQYRNLGGGFFFEIFWYRDLIRRLSSRWLCPIGLQHLFSLFKASRNQLKPT